MALGDINWSATLHATAGVVSPGDGACRYSSGVGYVVATTTNLAAAGGLFEGVFLDAGAPGGSVRIQYVGPIDAGVTGLGSGAAGDVSLDTNGRMVRGVTAVPIGTCNARGDVVLSSGGGSAGTGTSDVDVFNVLDYIEAGDAGDHALAATRALADMRPPTSNLVPGYRGILYFPALIGGYTFKTTVRVTIRVIIRGAVAGGTTITCDSWVSAFTSHGNTNSLDYGNSAAQTIIEHIEFIGGPQPNTIVNTANSWLQNRAQVVGDWIIPGNQGMPAADMAFSWEYSYVCIKAGTTANKSAAAPAANKIAPSYSDNFYIPGGGFAASFAAYNAGPRPWSPLGQRVDINGATQQSTWAVNDVMKVSEWRNGYVDPGLPGPENLFYVCTATGTGGSYTGPTPGIVGSSPPSATAAGQVFYDGGVQWTSFTTGEPEWRNAQSIDESVIWTAGRLNFIGSVVRPTAGKARYDAIFHCEAGYTGTAGGGTEPAAFAVVGSGGAVFGDTVADGATTWRCRSSGAEAPAAAYLLVVHAYVRGDKVVGSGGSYFVCTVAGTTSGVAPVEFATSQANYADVVDNGTLRWRCYFLGQAQVLDGTGGTAVVWSTRVVSAVRSATSVYLDDVGASHFPNSGHHIQADASAVPAGDASFSGCRDYYAYANGAIITTRGGDVNGGVFANIIGFGSNNYPQQQYPDKALNDRGFLGNHFYSPRIQSVGGTAYTTSSAGSGSLVAGHLEDLGLMDPVSTGGGCTIFGGTFNTSLPIHGRGKGLGGVAANPLFTSRASWAGILAAGYANNIKNNTSTVAQNALCEFGLSELYMSSALKDGNGYYSWLYGAKEAYWWAHCYGAQANKNATQVSTALSDRGAGFSWMQNGLLVGQPKALVGGDVAIPDGGVLSNTVKGTKGDWVFNSVAALGSPVGWSCTVGTGVGAGTWQEGPRLRGANVQEGGAVSQAEGDAPRVETAANLANRKITYTGAMAAGRTVTFATPAGTADYYEKTIFNNTTGGFAITFTCGGGATVDIAAGKTAILGFDSGGAVTRITADV